MKEQNAVFEVLPHFMYPYCQFLSFHILNLHLLIVFGIQGPLHLLSEHGQSTFGISYFIKFMAAFEHSDLLLVILTTVLVPKTF